MAFEFIYGGDDYLVSKAAAERFGKLREGCDDEFGVEVIDGNCLKVDDVVSALHRFREATQTVGLFGGARAVWLKGINFMASGVLGGSSTVADELADLKEILEGANPDDVRILFSASPVDKRLSFFKWASKSAQAKEIASLDNLDEHQLATLAQDQGIKFEGDAASIFLKKVGTDARALESELAKLSLYFGPTADPSKPQTVTVELVMELTSEQNSSEFFEPLEAFYTRRPDWALESLERYFRAKGASARPLIVAFFNRNRLLLLIKAALDAGLAKAGFRGLSWSASANDLQERFGEEKTPFNLFKQNPWYLGNLAKEANRFSLSELQAIQEGLFKLFEAIHQQDEATAFGTFFAKFAAKAA